MPVMIWNRKKSHQPADMAVGPKAYISGYQFTLKGSPRFYEDVKRIISDGGAQVYFSEALTYERGAAVALWRVRTNVFDWLPKLYDFWVEQERTEPIASTFHLYLPSDLKYPALDLRTHSPAEVEAFIRANAPVKDDSPFTGRTKLGPPENFVNPK
ncbi:MAG: hypothetical protein KC435_03390 [Thermomicrobiales bacterium]|nr:hypothetical protein [Thermomicrobiales bacterium]